MYATAQELQDKPVTYDTEYVVETDEGFISFGTYSHAIEHYEQAKSPAALSIVTTKTIHRKG